MKTGIELREGYGHPMNVASPEELMALLWNSQRT